MKKQKSLKILFFFFFIIFPSYALNLEKGKTLFNLNCTACHQKGENLIIPEKNLKKEILQANGMYSLNAIKYQILNGKNGMPAFGGRLKEQEIEEIANYIIIRSEKNFDL
jgi:cytochrome c6